MYLIEHIVVGSQITLPDGVWEVKNINGDFMIDMENTDKNSKNSTKQFVGYWKDQLLAEAGDEPIFVNSPEVVKALENADRTQEATEKGDKADKIHEAFESVKKNYPDLSDRALQFLERAEKQIIINDFDSFDSSILQSPATKGVYGGITNIDKIFDGRFKEIYNEINSRIAQPNPQITESSDNISVSGHEGTWYVIDSKEIDRRKLFLLEHEEYGDEAANIIIDEKGELVLDDVHNGFDDYYESVEDPLDTAIRHINEYSEKEFNEEANFSNMDHIDLAYTTDEDTDLPIEIYADLESWKIVKKYNNVVVSEDLYDSLADMCAELAYLDFKENPEVRKYLAERAELLGAIRLPNTAFKANAGTEVTSDILFLQKRDRPISIEENPPEWVFKSMLDNGIAVNKYFADHPEMILTSKRTISLYACKS